METKRKKLVLISLLSALTAALLHSYLAYKYYGLKYGFSNSSVCNINERFNCDVASTSSFADLFGVPVALIGVLTNLVLLTFTLNGLVDTPSAKRPYRYGYYLSYFVFFVSIVMAIISALYLSSYCPFCILAYILSIIGLISYHFSFDKAKKLDLVSDIPHLFRENKFSLYLLLAIPIVSFFIHFNVQKRFTGERLELFIQDSLNSWKQHKEFSFDQNHGLTKGPEKAKFQIVEFADYLCPHCKNAITPLKTFLAGHQDASLTFKPFPLDGSCNAGLGPNSKGNGIRCQLAYAVFCAEKEFKQGWEYHEFIFEQQERFHNIDSSAEVENKICQFNPNNCETLKKCMGSEEAENWVKTASKEGTDSEVAGTPTVFVNGKKLDGGSNLMVLKSLYKDLNL